MCKQSKKNRPISSLREGHVGYSCLQGCSVSSVQFRRLKWSAKLYRNRKRWQICFLCRVLGGKAATGESAVRDSQDATEAGRAVRPAGGERGGGGGGLNHRWRRVSHGRTVLFSPVAMETDQVDHTTEAGFKLVFRFWSSRTLLTLKHVKAWMRQKPQNEFIKCFWL